MWILAVPWNDAVTCLIVPPIPLMLTRVIEWMSCKRDRSHAIMCMFAFVLARK